MNTNDPVTNADANGGDAGMVAGHPLAPTKSEARRCAHCGSQVQPIRFVTKDSFIQDGQGRTFCHAGHREACEHEEGSQP